MPASSLIIAAIEALWRIPWPGTDNLLASPQFGTLSELYQAESGGGNPVFALGVALGSLGVTCHIQAKRAALDLGPHNGENELKITFPRNKPRRRAL